MDTAEWYRRFGAREAYSSPSYSRLSAAVAADGRLLALLDQLPEEKRQPNLLFGAVRFHGGPVHDPAAFADWVVMHWARLSADMMQRRTQTNEVGRCAPLLPLLAAIPGPIALLEVGASAGLCLFPDKYQYRYGDVRVGPADSPVVVECAVSGNVPLPTEMPQIVWRAGLDLNPLDVADAEQMRWLEALVWPEHEDRRQRLRAAIGIAAAEPPLMVTGDMLHDVPAVAAQAPADATLVVIHQAALTYVQSAEARLRFAAQMLALPGHWIFQEGPAGLPALTAATGDADLAWARNVVAMDGKTVAVAGPHGQELRWL